MRLFGLCTFVRFETMICPSIRFDYKLIELQKAFRHFLTAKRKKTFQRIFSYDSGCKGKLWAIFLPRVHLWKKQIPGSWLKYINLSFKLEDSGFLDTLILVFVIEKCCLCICFTELYFFYWLLVDSLVILIAVPFVFSCSVNIACRSTQNAAR